MEASLHEIAEQFPTISDTALLDPTQVRCSKYRSNGQLANGAFLIFPLDLVRSLCFDGVISKRERPIRQSI